MKPPMTLNYKAQFRSYLTFYTDKKVPSFTACRGTMESPFGLCDCESVWWIGEDNGCRAYTILRFVYKGRKFSYHDDLFRGKEQLARFAGKFIRRVVGSK